MDLRREFTAPEPPMASRRQQHSADRRDRRQPAPGALIQERFGGSGGVTAGARPRGVLTQGLSGMASPIRNEFSGSVLSGSHGAAWRQGTASRRFAPVLARNF